MKGVTIGILAATAVFILNFQAAQADMCPLAKELAAKSLKTFQTDKKKGLAGLIQARKYCPENADIAYNLGLHTTNISGPTWPIPPGAHWQRKTRKILNSSPIWHGLP